MDERLEALMRLFESNLYFLRRNPNDFEIAHENEVLYQKMSECIPQEHCDEINLMVYGISRL